VTRRTGDPGTPLKAVGLTGQIVRGLLEGEEVLFSSMPKSWMLGKKKGKTMK
jgi:hypothetical protein